MNSVSQLEYGEDIDRVREMFADGKPHLPKEAMEISANAYSFFSFQHTPEGSKTNG